MSLTWKGSPNYTAGRQGKKIDRIVCHWIVGKLAAADAVFSKPGTSAHYAVGNDNIHQYVIEENTAYHAGNWEMNLRSIGIEHEGGPDLPISENTYRTSAKLIAEIAQRHKIPLDRTHIIEHREVKATQCPGTLDVNKLISLAKDQGTEVIATKDLIDLRRKEDAYNIVVDYLGGDKTKVTGVQIIEEFKKKR